MWLLPALNGEDSHVNELNRNNSDIVIYIVAVHNFNGQFCI